MAREKRIRVSDEELELIETAMAARCHHHDDVPNGKILAEIAQEYVNEHSTYLEEEGIEHETKPPHRAP
jgi:hypothetical protein